MQCDVTFHPTWWHRRAGISFDQRFHFDWRHRVETDREMRRTLHRAFSAFGLGESDPAPRPVLWTDMLAAGFLFSAMAGCDVRFSETAPPEAVCAHLDNAAVERLSLEDALRTHWWVDLLGQASELEAAFGHVVPCMNLMGVQNVALDLRGQELFIDYIDNPELAKRLLSFCASLLLHTGAWLKKLSPYVSGGVTGIVKKVMPDVYLHSNCTVELISRAFYEELLLPHDVALAAAFPPYGVHHCGQTMEHVAEGYAKIPGLAFVEVGAGSQVKAVRAAVGPSVHMNLRYSPVRLKDVSAAQMEEDIRCAVADAFPLGNVSYSCVGIDADVPDEQVALFFDTVRKVSMEIPSVNITRRYN